jgi:hypothetical protein
MRGPVAAGVSWHPRVHPRAGGSRRLLVPLARAGYGAVLLCAPGQVIRACTGRAADPRACRVTRVLGIRHLAQAAVTAWAPGPEVVTAGAAIDLCHAASMLALAAAGRPLRRAELADALAATTLAVAGPATTAHAAA